MSLGAANLHLFTTRTTCFVDACCVSVMVTLGSGLRLLSPVQGNPALKVLDVSLLHHLNSNEGLSGFCKGDHTHSSVYCFIRLAQLAKQHLCHSVSFTILIRFTTEKGQKP